MHYRGHRLSLFIALRREGGLRGLLARAAFSVSLLAGLLLAGARAYACDGCNNLHCVSGLEAGTYGCSEGEAKCSFIGRVFFDCGGRFCSTSGNVPCDNRKPIGGAHNTAIGSSVPIGTCPALPTTPIGVRSERTPRVSRNRESSRAEVQSVP